MASGHICTPTIPRYTAHANHLLRRLFTQVRLSAYMCRRRRCVDAGQPSAAATCSCVRQLVVVISFPRQHFESGPTSSTRRSHSEISEFTSTLTLACDATFRQVIWAKLMRRATTLGVLIHNNCLDLSLSLSSQFTFENCAAATDCKKH